MAYGRRENSIKKKFKILLIKNYELKTKDDDEEITVNIGSAMQQRTKLEDKKDKQKDLEKYNKEMKIMSKNMDRSFMSCKAFNNQNKLFFPLMIVMAVIGGLSFVALIDTPTFVFVMLI
jgi:hypothetical protein